MLKIKMDLGQLFGGSGEDMLLTVLVVRLYVAAKILKNYTSLACEAVVDQPAEFFETLKVEFFVENLVDKPYDPALLKEPHLDRLKEGTQLVKIPPQVLLVYVQQ